MTSYNKIAGQDTARIIAISDGVFGVAMTLLVLEIRVPLAEGFTSDKELAHSFLALMPKFLVYFLSFMTAGIFWTGHAAQFRLIEKSDRNLSWINLLFLLFVTLLPFSTAFLGDHINYKFPIGIYWLNIFLMGLLLYINWAYACKHNFVSDETKKQAGPGIRQRIIIAQTLYFFGALLCFISPYLSIGVIIAIQLNYAFVFFSGRKTKR
ncbi:hypothetical protein NIASO_19145 [Niabella soli DSM 19437]|uniref:DUF1211 domain-containing protein n=2 Tax=Niabella TaxID=379899 RepID=W0F5I8_9BACT|nr:hypothetical protein NIASO_19145 [Niabella soli DSM 19437]